MIVEMKEIIEQDRNRKVVKTLGYIPFHMSTWGRKDDEPEDPPATLYTICPKCLRSLKIENDRDSIKYEKGNGFCTIEGNKWGYQVNKGTSKRLIYMVGYQGHGGHLITIDHTNDGAGCLFRIYEEVDS